MNGGTTFHFVTDAIHAALERARQAAKGQDIRLGGGVATIRQYLEAGLIDELFLAISSILLSSSERFFANLDTLALGYHCTKHVATTGATYCILTKRSEGVPVRHAKKV